MSINGTLRLPHGVPPRPAPPTLLTLPDEILSKILLLLSSGSQSHQTLSALCLVCRRLNQLADPMLHRSLSFTHPIHHMTFSTSLATTRPRRGSLVYDIRLEYPGEELTHILHHLEDEATSPTMTKMMTRKIDHFSHSISTMSNLETLDIAVPDSLLHGIGTLFNGPFDLACLRTCSLFYQPTDGGKAYWDLQENIHIFSHPSLEHLTIKRARLSSSVYHFSLEQPEATPLQTLKLIECDISDDALSDLLLFPEALKEITITQLAIPEPDLEESPEDVEDYILAVQSAKHSLQRVVVDFPTLDAENPLRLRKFDHLVELVIGIRQLFGKKRLYSVGLPPEIEVLRFLDPLPWVAGEAGAGESGDGDEEDPDGLVDLFCYTIESMDVLARKLKKLIMPAGEKGVPKRVVEACARKGGFELVIV